jgi:hypothetical protein
MEGRMMNGEDLLSVADLVRMFEEAEESSQDARRLAERDRDYYDGKQLTDQEIAELRKRGQPEVVINRIKRKIDYLVGLEKQQRTMPRALPRTPVHEQDAHAATDALRFVAEAQDYASIRSAVWRNMLVEGIGAVVVKVRPKRPDVPALMGSTALSPQAEFEIGLKPLAWDRFFFDPHSCRLDFSDAAYLGGVLWMDLADALALYGEEARDALEATLTTSGTAHTYDDTPTWRVWADAKRKRVRVVFVWVKRAEQWHFAEFTKGGILKAGPSPYRPERDGDTACEIVAQSAYVDRRNNRYGVVREMISPQDEINKRRSKALHLLNVSQVTMEEGAVQDVERFRRESARPDGVRIVNPGYFDRIRDETRADLAEGHVRLLQEAKTEIDQMGPNLAMLGQQGSSASGRAIMASQQGGMIEIGDLLDSLRHLDRRVFRAIWSRIRQFWTAPMWVRITDDERNVRFVGLNQPQQEPVLNPATGQPLTDPATGRPILRPAVDPATGLPKIAAPVAMLDVDIIIDDAQDLVAPAIEQFQALVELKRMDAGGELPFRAIIEAAPNLRNKDKILDVMERTQQPNPAAAEAEQAGLALAMRGRQAEIAKTEAEAADRQASAMEKSVRAQRSAAAPIIVGK